MIIINLDKAKNIAHDIRRFKRSQEFAPLDIKATIPSEAESAEVQRQAIREKYSQIQLDIDNIDNVDALKSILDNITNSA